MLKRLLWRYEAGYCDGQALAQSIEAEINSLDERVLASRAETAGLTQHPSQLFLEYDETITRAVAAMGGTEYRDCVADVLRAAALAEKVEGLVEASREFEVAKEARRAVEIAVESEWLMGAMTMRVMSELLFTAEECLRRFESHQAAFIARLCAEKARAFLSCDGGALSAMRLRERIARIAEVAVAVEGFEATPHDALLVRNAVGRLAALVEDDRLTLAEQLVSDCEADFEVRRQFLKEYGRRLDGLARDGRSKLALDEEVRRAVARGSWAGAVEHLLHRSLNRVFAEMEVLQMEAAQISRRLVSREQEAQEQKSTA